MSKRFNRFIAIFLSIVMIIGMMPDIAMVEGATTEGATDTKIQRINAYVTGITYGKNISEAKVISFTDGVDIEISEIKVSNAGNLIKTAPLESGTFEQDVMYCIVMDVKPKSGYDITGLKKSDVYVNNENAYSFNIKDGEKNAKIVYYSVIDGQNKENTVIMDWEGSAVFDSQPDDEPEKAYEAQCGRNINITAPAAVPGLAFSGWTLSTEGYAAVDDKTSVSTSFRMPAADVKITPSYLPVESYTPKISTAAVDVTAPKKYEAGKKASITGDEAVVTATEWYEGDKLLDAGATFETGKEYTVLVTLRTLKGVFTDSTVFTINGKKAELVYPADIVKGSEEAKIAYKFSVSEILGFTGGIYIRGFVNNETVSGVEKVLVEEALLETKIESNEEWMAAYMEGNVSTRWYMSSDAVTYEEIVSPELDSDGNLVVKEEYRDKYICVKRTYETG